MLKNRVFKIILVILIVLLVIYLILFIVSGDYKEKGYLNPWNKEYMNKFSDIREKVVSQAILAANGHNMQPWLVKLDKSNSNLIYLYANPDRLVLEVDPFARQTMVSQGTFLEYLAISAKNLGYTTNMELFPEGGYDETNLKESMNQKPVAKINLENTEAIDNLLYEYMFLSDTNRGSYKLEKLTDDEINDLISINNEADIELKIFQDDENLKKLGDYAIEGASIEAKVDRINEESSKIFRVNEYEKNKYSYGFSIEGQGTNGFMKTVLQGLLTIIPSLNSTETTADSMINSTKIAVENTPAYAMILSKDNSRQNQVKAGMLYSRLILKAHSLGYVMQPPSQVLEEYSEMKEAYSNIHNEYATYSQTIQMFIRLGKPTTEYPLSMRQDLSKFIIE